VVSSICFAFNWLMLRTQLALVHAVSAQTLALRALSPERRVVLHVKQSCVIDEVR